MGKANGIYKRNDNRWEARYKKGVGPNGRAIYGAVYGSSREEVEEKRKALIGEPNQQKVPIFQKKPGCKVVKYITKRILYWHKCERITLWK